VFTILRSPVSSTAQAGFVGSSCSDLDFMLENGDADMLRAYGHQEEGGREGFNLVQRGRCECVSTAGPLEPCAAPWCIKPIGTVAPHAARKQR